MRYRVHLAKRFRSAKDALKWVREDVDLLKSLPRAARGWLEDRPRWAVTDGGKTILTVDEWGREEATTPAPVTEGECTDGME